MSNLVQLLIAAVFSGPGMNENPENVVTTAETVIPCEMKITSTDTVYFMPSEDIDYLQICGIISEKRIALV